MNNVYKTGQNLGTTPVKQATIAGVSELVSTHLIKSL